METIQEILGALTELPPVLVYPVDRDLTRVYVTDYRNDIADEPGAIADAVAFQMAVGAEDREILERIRSKAVPLDPTVEFHSRADRITLEMRRVLRDLVELAASPPVVTVPAEEPA